MIFLPAMVMVASPAPAVDWGARLRADALQFRSGVLDSHPGSVDPENRNFRPLLERAVAHALERSRTASTFPAYSWALDELSASLDDGHLGISADPKADAAYPWSFRWPGVLTTLSAGQHKVVRSIVADVPVGSTLLSCDGQPAEQLAEQRIGRFYGRWMLRSRREALAKTLLLPPDNPWLKPLTTCRFAVNGSARSVRLAWRPLSAGRRTEILASVSARHASPVSLERLTDGSYWIAMGSFETDPSSADGRRLTELNGAITGAAASLRSAPRLIFDLRGNNGGSSAWITQAARTIWGGGAVEKTSNPAQRVVWRVSDPNIAQMKHYVAMFQDQRSSNPAPYEWAAKRVAGLETARARGDQLWTEPEDRSAVASPATVHPVSAKVFVLTDYGCASACLDAVDLLTGLGAVQLGQETSADTPYMEVRVEKFSDGAMMWLPMKAYRGRPRGSNVPATPRHEWPGSMNDTDALKQWIAGLRD